MMADEFLTDDQLLDFTGYVQPARQAAYLERQGIRYHRRRDGKVRVTWTQINALPAEVRAGPNLEAARG